MKTEELNREIVKAATSVAFEWPGVIEADDVQQEIWIKLLESQNYVDQLIAMEPPQRSESLKLIGHQVASRYRNDYELFTGNAYYGTDHVRKLLDAGLLTVSRRDLGSMGETLTEFLDLQDAFADLKNRNKDYAQAVWSSYVEGVTPDNGAKERKLRRAVRSLTDRMNQAHRRRFAEYEEGPGTRKAISNEKARIVTKTDLNGDNKLNAFAQ